MDSSPRVSRPLRHEEILDLLSEVGAALSEQDHNADVYVAGGAAMALRYGARGRDVTDDVDALFRRDPRLLREAERIAVLRGLDLGWFNDHFAAFMPRQYDDDEATVVLLGGLKVRIASPRFLLAMKMHAGRPKDLPDAVLLVQDLHLTSAIEIADLTLELYGDDSVPAIDPADVELLADYVLREARRTRPPVTRPSQPDQTIVWHQGRVRAGSPAGGQFLARTNSPPSGSLL